MNEDSTNERVCLEDNPGGNPSNCNGSGTIFDVSVSVRTVSLWYKADEVGNTPQVLFEEGGYGHGQVIYLNATKIFACTWRNNVAECVSYTTTANEWHHVALVWVSGTTSYLYHDGEEVATFTGKDNDQHNNASALGNIAQKTRMAVDGDPDGGEFTSFDTKPEEDYSFAGIIDEFRVTNTVLTSAEIQTLYNSESNDDFIKVGVVLSESISFTDSISTAAGVNLSESISLTDSISKAAGVNLSDTVSLTYSI
jgi:hypothetical protein